MINQQQSEKTQQKAWRRIRSGFENSNQQLIDQFWDFAKASHPRPYKQKIKSHFYSTFIDSKTFVVTIEHNEKKNPILLSKWNKI